ncbi:MAG: DUF503 domain-containing protein [Planctomycetes bacterium]|nr:DUF503 domain-containing protein [Planctomycetota bacterium]
MNVGILQIELEIPSAFSLKDKRGVVKSLKERIRQRFNVSAAEVDGQETWNRAVIGVACVAIDARTARDTLDKVLRFAEEHEGSIVGDSTIEIL